MVRAFIGAVLVVAGIATFIEAHSHHPQTLAHCADESGTLPCLEPDGFVHVGLSQTGYDLLRIGGWALIIIGALLVIVGLIAYARRGPVRSAG
jgi:uncharacterized membrane protein HdeD (DUF308 family)